MEVSQADRLVFGMTWTVNRRVIDLRIQGNLSIFIIGPSTCFPVGCSTALHTYLTGQYPHSWHMKSYQQGWYRQFDRIRDLWARLSGRVSYIPEIRILGDELAHHLLAKLAMHIDHLDAFLLKICFRSQARQILSKDHPFYAIEVARSAAHVTW